MTGEQLIKKLQGLSHYDREKECVVYIKKEDIFYKVNNICVIDDIDNNTEIEIVLGYR